VAQARAAPDRRHPRRGAPPSGDKLAGVAAWRTASCFLLLAADARISGPLSGTLGFLYVDSHVADFAADRSLEGKRVPQVPRTQGSAGLRFASPAFTLAVSARFAGPQFDDDQKRFRLSGFGRVDVFGSVPVGERLSIFAAVENLFDRRYEIARTPVASPAPPRSFRAGARLRLPPG